MTMDGFEQIAEASRASHVSTGSAHKDGYRTLYDEISRRLDLLGIGAVSLFLNFGYAPVDASDESARPVPEGIFNPSSVHLVYEVVADTRLNGARVLDVGCGRGGSTVQLAETFGATVLGVDLSPEAIAFCRRTHAGTEAVFEVGDAEHLPVADHSMDAVFNLESSHSYPSLRTFLLEVRRVLRAGGWFLYADILRTQQWEEVRQLLGELGLTVEADRDITQNVMRSRHQAAERDARALATSDPVMQNFLATPGTAVYQQMAEGACQYRIIRARAA